MLGKLIAGIVHAIRYNLTDPPARGLRTRGNWRVRYPDGHLSAGMAYGNAHDYAEIFHGSVERIPYRKAAR